WTAARPRCWPGIAATSSTSHSTRRDGGSRRRARTASSASGTWPACASAPATGTTCAPGSPASRASRSARGRRRGRREAGLSADFGRDAPTGRYRGGVRPRFVVLLWLTACAAVPRLPAASAARIDAAAVKEVKDGAVAGVSVAVARGGEVTFAAGWGLASLDPPIPAGADTRYRIQSIAKLLTAVAALKLVEDGRLALADPVARWFPGLPAGVTVRPLLTPTSGLAAFWKLEPYKRSPPERPVDVVPLVAAAPPNFAPGTRFDYANTNFLLLGLIVERVAGRPLADVLADAVFRPAGMTATGLDCDAIST